MSSDPYTPPSWGPPPAVADPPAPYTDDEHIYLRTPLHFRALVPVANVWIDADDGMTTAGDPWAVVSPTNDFAAAGIMPGMLAFLTGPPEVYARPPEIYVVDHVDAADPHALHTRRAAAAPGAGLPPGPPAGIVGISFHIPTLMPQIRHAGGLIDARWKVGIDPWRQRSRMTPHALVQAEDLCANMVLRDQFLAMAGSYFESGQGRTTFVAMSEEFGARAKLAWDSFAPSFYLPMPNPTPRRYGYLFRV